MNNIDQLINEETKKRINYMESPMYVFPEKMLKNDYFFICVGIFCSIILIILCMCGVIV